MRVAGMRSLKWMAAGMLGLGLLGAAAERSYDASPEDLKVYAAFLDQSFKPKKNDGPGATSALIIENEAMDAWQKNRRAWESFLLKKITGPGRASDEALHAFLLRVPRRIRFFSFPAIRVPLRLVRSDQLNRTVAKGW